MRVGLVNQKTFAPQPKNTGDAMTDLTTLSLILLTLCAPLSRVVVAADLVVVTSVLFVTSVTYPVTSVTFPVTLILSIRQVVAADSDSGDNAAVRYSLLPGPHTANFRLDPETGFLYPAKRIAAGQGGKTVCRHIGLAGYL